MEMSVKVSLNFITGLVALPTTRFVAYSTVEFLASGFLYRFRFNLNGGGGGHSISIYSDSSNSLREC